MISTFPSDDNVLLEVPNPIYCRIIIGPAIRRGFDDPGRREIGAFVPWRKVVFTLYNEKQRYYKTVATYALDRCCLFLIAWLQLLTSSAAVRTCNDHYSADNAYYKASFIEVIEIAVLDTILRMYILYQLELLFNKLRIFVEGSLEVVGTRKTYL